jgi:hypothetical protein
VTRARRRLGLIAVAGTVAMVATLALMGAAVHIESARATSTPRAQVTVPTTAPPTTAPPTTAPPTTAPPTTAPPTTAPPTTAPPTTAPPTTAPPTTAPPTTAPPTTAPPRTTPVTTSPVTSGEGGPGAPTVTTRPASAAGLFLPGAVVPGVVGLGAGGVLEPSAPTTTSPEARESLPSFPAILAKLDGRRRVVRCFARAVIGATATRAVTSTCAQPQPGTTPTAPGDDVNGARAVTVMTIGDFSEVAGNQVWADAVLAHFEILNLQGGVRDARGIRHPVRVLVCDSTGAGGGSRCAHSAVATHASAIVGLAVADSRGMWSRLERAGIPVIGTHVAAASDATSPVSFPLAPGVPGTFTAMPQLAADAGARHIGVLVSDHGGATDAAIDFVRRGVAMTPASLGPIVRVPAGTADVSRYVGEATVGVDGLVALVDGGTPGSVLQALQAQAFPGWYVTASPFGAGPRASDPIIGQSALVVGQFGAVGGDGAGARSFTAEMDTAPAGAELPRTEGAVNAWLAARVFEAAASTTRTLDAHHLLATLRRGFTIDAGGLTPTLQPGARGTPFARLSNTAVTFERVLGGSSQPLGPRFVDPFRPTS